MADIGVAADEHFDVLIVGAGLSGVGAACHLTMRCPGKRFALLEARDAIGGTWDLFRYPGVRSDSDMQTLGYSFRPWTGEKAIADGPSILSYVRDTAAEYGVDRKIRFGHRVVSAAYSTRDARWTVEAEHDGVPVRLTCAFLMMCSGYYDYAGGYQPDFPGLAEFGGQVIHPQAWPDNLDYAGKRVVVIGSGATAVTLVPAMAGTAAHVTMLQRSPTYIVSRPSRDAIADWLRRTLPARAAYGLARLKNILFQLYFYNLARRQPAKVKAGIIGLARQALGPDFDYATHLTPKYNPWDQRLCLIPDGDLFESLKAGTSSIVTGQIEAFTRDGVRLASGETLDADIVVTATGLRMKLMGGMRMTVDGTEVKPSDTMNYKGVMFSGVPNLAYVFGYTNASWTLKADLSCGFVCRVLNHMDRHGYAQCVPIRASGVEELPMMELTSGYVQRARAELPKQGAVKPWRLYQNYARDVLSIRMGRVDDGTLTFSRLPQTVAAKEPALA